MPRMSQAEKRKSRDRILAAAADLFRDQGIGNTGVAEVMKAAGMTHGGFYRHFSDKDHLVAAAFDRAVDSVVGDLETAEDAGARAAARRAYVETYLSGDHVENTRHGCPMAALGSELVRAGGDTGARTGAAVDRVTDLLQETETDTLADARLALLVGAVTLARLAHDAPRAEAILASARTALSRLSDG